MLLCLHSRTAGDVQLLLLGCLLFVSEVCHGEQSGHTATNLLIHKKTGLKLCFPQVDPECPALQGDREGACPGTIIVICKVTL